MGTIYGVYTGLLSLFMVLSGLLIAFSNRLKYQSISDFAVVLGAAVTAPIIAHSCYYVRRELHASLRFLVDTSTRGSKTPKKGSVLSLQKPTNVESRGISPQKLGNEGLEGGEEPFYKHQRLDSKYNASEINTENLNGGSSKGNFESVPCSATHTTLRIETKESLRGVDLTVKDMKAERPILQSNPQSPSRRTRQRTMTQMDKCVRRSSSRHLAHTRRVQIRKITVMGVCFPLVVILLGAAYLISMLQSLSNGNDKFSDVREQLAKHYDPVNDVGYYINIMLLGAIQYFALPCGSVTELWTNFCNAVIFCRGWRKAS